MQIPTYARCRRTYRSNIIMSAECCYIAVTRRHLLIAVWVVGWYIGVTHRESVRRKHVTAECRSWRGRERRMTIRWLDKNNYSTGSLYNKYINAIFSNNMQ